MKYIGTSQKVCLLPYTRAWFCLLVEFNCSVSLALSWCCTTKPRNVLSGVWAAHSETICSAKTDWSCCWMWFTSDQATLCKSHWRVLEIMGETETYGTWCRTALGSGWVHQMDHWGCAFGPRWHDWSLAQCRKCPRRATYIWSTDTTQVHSYSNTLICTFLTAKCTKCKHWKTNKPPTLLENTWAPRVECKDAYSLCAQCLTHTYNSNI